MKNPEEARDRAEALAREFDALYAQWSDRLYRYIVHMIGPGAEAEDLFQDTWMKVVEQIDQLRDRERFGPWAMRIARNLTYNRFRERKRKTQIWAESQLGREDYEGEGLLDREPDREPDPRESMVHTQRVTMLNAAIDELDAESREMLHLRYFEHLRLAEVADVMDLPLGTVCVKVQRSLKKVRRRLMEMGVEDARRL